MSLIVYLPEIKEAGKRLQRMIGDLTCQDSIEIFFSLEKLDFRIRNSPRNGDIVLLFIANRKDLDELMPYRQIFDGMRIVTIVPDREKETVSKGHLFRPRYLSFKDSDFSDLSQVLKKLLNTNSPKDLMNTY